MKFIDINNRRPNHGQQVLVKTNEDWIPYCVCDYNTNNKEKPLFEEHSQGRLYWLEKEIGGWLPIEDIEKEQVHCKDCINRYDEYHCPVAEFHECDDEDDGWDYWYTWGASEDDDFYCKHGIRGCMEEEDANI